MGIFHAILQMLRRGQNCEFWHIKCRGKNKVTNLIKLLLTSIFLHIESIYIAFISAFIIFENYLSSYKMALSLTHPI